MIKPVKGKRAYNPALRREQAQGTRQRILDAARRLLVRGTYSSVKMEAIAEEAGVAYQTVYSIFGTKPKLARAIVDSGFPHVADAVKLFDPLSQSDDPERWLRTAARVSRLIYEPCADLLRFMRESGDPHLLAHYRKREEERYMALSRSGLEQVLGRSGRLRAGISSSEALSVSWSMTGPDGYSELVFQRHWTPSRYEEWLGDALVDMLLA